MSTTTTVAGGAWYDDTDVCRSAYRDDRHPGDRFDNLSFRLALDTVQPSRAIRGGLWFDGGCYLRSAYRDYVQPGFRSNGSGLRLSLTTEPVKPKRTVSIEP